MTNFCPPFLLIRADGFVDEFDDLLSLAVATRHRISIEDYHIVHSRDQIFTNNWIVRDSFGQIVTANDIAAMMTFHHHGARSRKRHALIRQAMERGLPIPHTGRRRRGHYYRRNRSVGYNRACAATAVDAREWPECSTGRAAVYMPDNYDDLPVTARKDRTWKRFRGTQWKQPRLP